MSINFPKTEEEVIRFWREVDAFQTQLRLTEGRPHFNFYDGPPFGMTTSALSFPVASGLIEYMLTCYFHSYWSARYLTFHSRRVRIAPALILTMPQVSLIMGTCSRLPSKISYHDTGP